MSMRSLYQINIVNSTKLIVPFHLISLYILIETIEPEKKAWKIVAYL